MEKRLKIRGIKFLFVTRPVDTNTAHVVYYGSLLTKHFSLSLTLNAKLFSSAILALTGIQSVDNRGDIELIQ